MATPAPNTPTGVKPEDARSFSAFAALLAAVETEQAIAEPPKTTVTAAAPSARPAKRQRNSATSELSRSVGSDSEMGTHEFSDNSSAADHEDEPWQALASLSQCVSHGQQGGVCPYRHCACPGYDGCAHPDGAWCKMDQPTKRKLCSPCQDAQLVSVAPESPSQAIGTTSSSKRSPRSQSIGRPSRCPNPKHASGCPEQHCKCGGYGSFCPHGAGECTSTQNVKWRKFCNACLSAKRRYTKATAAPVVMQARPQPPALTPALPPMAMQPGAFQAMAAGYRPVPYMMAMPTSFVYPMMPNFSQPVMHRVAMQ